MAYASRMIAALHPSRAEPFRFAGRRFGDRHARPAYLICAGAGAVLIAAVATGAFSCDARLLTGTFGTLGFFIALGWAARWVGFDRLATSVEIVLVLLLGTVLLGYCSVVAASSGVPLADARLATADRLLFGIDRDALVASALHLPFVRMVARFAYLSLSYTPPIVTVSLVISGRRQLAWTVATALIASLALSVCGLALVPAYGRPPYPYQFAQVLATVRDGTSRTLDADVLTGLVTFPSVHAAHSVVLGWASYRLGRRAAPLVALHAAMLASALLIGGHYLVDLAAGVALAVGTIRAAQIVHRRVERGGDGRPAHHHSASAASASSLVLWPMPGSSAGGE